MLKKIIHITIALLFFIFAALQFNDKDGIMWILLYLAVAALPLLILFGKEKKHLNYFLAGLFLMLLFLKYPFVTDWLEAGQPKFIDYEPTSIKAVEGIREYLGLVICALTTLVYLFVKRN